MKPLQLHATKHLWQNPGADGQFNAKMFRLTPKTGTVSVLSDGDDFIKLPERTKWYHCFTIGSVHPNWGNFDIPVSRWVKAKDMVNHFSCFIRIYTDLGHCFPLEHAWLARKSNGAIIIALPVLDIYPSFTNEDVYIRIYAGLAHITKPIKSKALTVVYRTIRTTDERPAIIAEYEKLVADNPGEVSVWVNGYYRPNFKLEDMGAWDDIEFYIDNTIIRKEVFNVSDLNSFTSKLDACRKYLLHCPKKTDDWLFSDDVEFYVTSDNFGYYYNGNLSNYIRQLTHADFSVPTARVKQFFLNWDNRDRSESSVVTVNDLKIVVMIRDDHLERKLTYNADRVHDLYRLKDEQIIEAMVGVNSHVKEWQASSLENSSVNKLAYARYENITLPLCTEAYGYNAIGRYLSDTPQLLTHDGVRYQTRLPDNLASGCEVYEYDARGVLLGHAKHPNGEVYFARNDACRLIEAIPSFASEGLDVIDNMEDGLLSSLYDYRFYLRKILGDVPSEEYEEAVEGKDYTIEGMFITWNVDRARRHPTAVTTKNHIFYTVDVDQSNGRYVIPIENLREGKKLPISFKVETVELWMNGRSLVNGIDYVRVDNQAVIRSKVWTSTTGTDQISVRVRGINGEPKEADTGFVVNGKLSDNDRYDVRDDKVVRIVAGGALFAREEVSFGEDNSVGLTNHYDGFPYSVDAPTVPLKDNFDRKEGKQTTYSLRDASRDLDNRVENYLSVHLEKPVLNTRQELPHYYHLFSPVLSAMLADIRSGLLVPVEDSITDRISTKQLDEIMTRYNRLLAFDPARNGFDRRFCIVHPHNLYQTIAVKELSYVLLERVNHRYLNFMVQLNQYLKIGDVNE